MPLSHQVYRVFGPPRGASLVLQVRHHETRKAIDPSQLVAFRATTKIKTPWTFDIPRGSRLLILPEAAHYMVKHGTVASLDEAPLIPWRDREAAAQGKLSRG